MQSQMIYRLSRGAVLAAVMFTSAGIFARTLIPISARDPRDNIQPTHPVRGGGKGGP